eukprot:scaffold15228_cov118-Isochrysis_galbana.AAC.9
MTRPAPLMPAWASVVGTGGVIPSGQWRYCCLGRRRRCSTSRGSMIANQSEGTNARTIMVA